MNILISSDAEDDISNSVAFYEKHGLEVGDYFLNSILADIESLKVLQGVHAKRFGYHCMAAKRFPYAIYYRVEEETVYVVAVLDERRNPEWIAKRLENE